MERVNPAAVARTMRDKLQGYPPLTADERRAIQDALRRSGVHDAHIRFAAQQGRDVLRLLLNPA